MPEENKPPPSEEVEKEEEARALAELCADDPRKRTATREDGLEHAGGYR
jgi:hypothetical protein